MKNVNFIKAREKASEILLLQSNDNFPIDLFNLNFKEFNIIIFSFQKYSKLTGVKIEDLFAQGNGKDGYSIPNIRNNISLILYNENIESSGRIRWTIAHEIGHLALKHKKQGAIEEIEADTFASQLLAPQCILKKLVKSRVNLSTKYLMEKFALSEKAAINSIKKITNKLENNNGLFYDEYILQKYISFIQGELPKNYIDDMYIEELEEKRNLWN